jgi:hypothetical protein
MVECLLVNTTITACLSPGCPEIFHTFLSPGFLSPGFCGFCRSLEEASRARGTTRRSLFARAAFAQRYSPQPQGAKRSWDEDTKIHLLRFIVQPMNIPVATPIVIPVAMPIENVAITVSTGCRCRRLIVSSMSSSAVSPPCFAMRRVAPKLSSSASAMAVDAREACRAASAIRSPVHSTTDCAMMY